jgi:hypothetical protein
MRVVANTKLDLMTSLKHIFFKKNYKFIFCCSEVLIWTRRPTFILLHTPLKRFVCLRVNSALPSSLLLLLFFLPFTWGHQRRARATTALPGATSLELLILFAEVLVRYATHAVCRIAQ